MLHKMCSRRDRCRRHRKLPGWSTKDSQKPNKRRKRKKMLEGLSPNYQSLMYHKESSFKHTQMPSIFLLLIVMPLLLLLLLSSMFSAPTGEGPNSTAKLLVISFADGQLLLDHSPYTSRSSYLRSSGHRLRPKHSAGSNANEIIARISPLLYRPLRASNSIGIPKQRTKFSQSVPLRPTFYAVNETSSSPTITRNPFNNFEDNRSSVKRKENGRFGEDEVRNDGPLSGLESLDSLSWTLSNETEQKELVRRLSSTMLLETLLRRPFPANRSPFPPLPSPMTLLPSLRRHELATTPATISSSSTNNYVKFQNHLDGYTQPQQVRRRFSPLLEVSTSNQSIISTSDNEIKPPLSRQQDGQSTFSASSLNYLVEKLLNSVKPQNGQNVSMILENVYGRPMTRKKIPSYETSGSDSSLASLPKNDSGITTLDKLIRDEYNSRVQPMIEILDKRQKLTTMVLKGVNNSVMFDMSTTKAQPLNHKIDDEYLVEATTRGEGTTTLNPPENQAQANQGELPNMTTTVAPLVSASDKDASLSNYNGVFSLDPRDDDNSWVSFEDLEDQEALDEVSEDDDETASSTNEKTDGSKDEKSVSTAGQARSADDSSSSTVRPTVQTATGKREPPNTRQLYNVPPYIFLSEHDLNVALSKNRTQMPSSEVFAPPGSSAITEAPQAASGSTTSGTNNVAILDESPSGVVPKSKGKTKSATSTSRTRIGERAPNASTPRGSLVFSDGDIEAERANGRNNQTRKAPTSSRGNQASTRKRSKNESPTSTTTTAAAPAATSKRQYEKREESFLLNQLLSTIDPLSELDLRLKEPRRQSGEHKSSGYSTTDNSLTMTTRPHNPLAYSGYVGKDDYLFSSTARDWSRPISSTRQQASSTPSMSSYSSGERRQKPYHRRYPTTTTTPAPPTEPPSVPYNYFLHQPVTNAQSVPTMVIPPTDPPTESSGEMPPNRLSSGSSKKFSLQLPNNDSPSSRNQTLSQRKKLSDFVPMSESEITTTNSSSLSDHSVTSDRNWSPTKMTNMKSGDGFVSQRKLPKSPDSNGADQNGSKANRSTSAGVQDFKAEPPNLFMTSEEPVNLFSVGDDAATADRASDTWQRSTTPPPPVSATTNQQRNKSKSTKTSQNDESSMGDTDLADGQRPRKFSTSNKRRPNSTSTTMKNSDMLDEEPPADSADSDSFDGQQQETEDGRRRTQTIANDDNNRQHSKKRPSSSSADNLTQGVRVLLVGNRNSSSGTIRATDNRSRQNGSAPAGEVRPAGSEIQITEFDKGRPSLFVPSGGKFPSMSANDSLTRQQFRLATGNLRPVRVNSLYPAQTVSEQQPAVVPSTYFGDQLAGSEIPLLHYNPDQQLQPATAPDLALGGLAHGAKPTLRKPSLAATEDPYQFTGSDNIMTTLLQPGLSGAPATAGSKTSTPGSGGSGTSTVSSPAGDESTSSSDASQSLPPTTSSGPKLSGASQKTGNDRLAFILIGGSCALSVVCLVLAAMSMRCQDMCDDYRSLRNAERAALKLQKHRLKYTKKHQISRYADQTAALQLANELHQPSELANQCNSRCLNESAATRSIQFAALDADQQVDPAAAANRAIWNSQQQQQPVACRCQNCLLRTPIANCPASASTEQEKENFAWMRSYLRQHGHASGNRLRPLFGVASSVGTFFPRRPDEQQRFSGGSSDAQILIDGQPSCVAAGTFDRGCRQQLQTRSKSILAKSNVNSSHLDSGCGHHNQQQRRAQHHQHRSQHRQHSHRHATVCNHSSPQTSSEPSDSSVDGLVVCNGAHKCRHQPLLKPSHAKYVARTDHHLNHQHHHQQNQAASSSSADSAQCTCSRASADQQPLLAAAANQASKYRNSSSANHRTQQQAKRDKQLIWSANCDRLI